MALKKQNRLLGKDFLKNKKGGFWGRGVFLNIKINKNNFPESRFGFVVGLNISKKSVARNLIKRQLRAIIEKNIPVIKKGFDVIVITHPQIVEKNYQEIEKDVLGALKQLKLLNY